MRSAMTPNAFTRFSVRSSMRLMKALQNDNVFVSSIRPISTVKTNYHISQQNKKTCKPSRLVDLNPWDTTHFKSRVSYGYQQCSSYSTQTSSSKTGKTESSGGASPTKKKKSKFLRFLLVSGVLGSGLYIYDQNFNARAFSRTLYSISVFLSIAIDYKLNFTEDEDIQALHLRSADKIYDMIVRNKGLYIKMGQAVAVQSSIFPPEFQKKFASLFDQGPKDPPENIKKIVREEFRKLGVEDINDIFEDFDYNAIASASVAQVHRATLKETGEKVAVKIQHADIRKQIELDLSTYKVMMWIYEKIFDMPIYFVANYIANRMRQEINFLQEVENSEITRKNVENLWGKEDPTGRFHPKVYVPKIYKKWCTQRVMVSEWIDGVSLSNKDKLRADNYNIKEIINSVLVLFSKQIFEWGAVHCDPHPGNVIVRRVRSTSSGNIFSWMQSTLLGRDPKMQEQVVLIDHGLYVHTTETFRGQYSQLWQSLFLLDNKSVHVIMKKWGIGSEELFGSAILLRPYTSEETQIKYANNELKDELSQFELQQKMKERMKTFISDSTKMPLELVFLGRCMNLLMGVNKMYGSPVNRIKIMAYEASKSFSYYKSIGAIDEECLNATRWGNAASKQSSTKEDEDNDEIPLDVPITERILISVFSQVKYIGGLLLPHETAQLFQAWIDYTLFRIIVGLSDIAFGAFRLGQFFTLNSKQRDQKGMEDYIEKQMVGMANKIGFKVEQGQMFSG